MKWIVGLGVVVAVALMLAGGGGAKFPSSAWISDLEAGKVKAASEGKNLLVDFTGSTWCGPCKRLKRGVFASREFAQFSQNVVLVALDYPPASDRTPEKIQADPKLAALMRLKQEYGVAAYPTVVLFDRQHREIGRIIGYGGEPAAAYLGRLGAGSTQPPM